MSVVRIGLSPRVATLTREAAQRYWRGTHAKIFANVPNLTSYVQNHAVLDSSGNPILGNFDFDIFSEVEFATEEALETAVSGAYYSDVVVPDERLLLNAEARCFLATRRIKLRGLPKANAFKLIRFVDIGLERISLLCPDERSYCAMVYKVLSARGWLRRPVLTILQTFFENEKDAVESARHELNGTNLESSVILAVVVQENEVVAREWQPL